MAHPLDDDRIDRTQLELYDFDEVRFRQEYERMLAGQLDSESAIVTETIEPAVDDVVDVDFTNEDLRQLGAEALRRGEVASVVLNGGMATRFGGVVKGVVEVYGGETFIALKAENVRRARQRYDASIPLVLMNSFATDDSTRLHIESSEYFGLGEDIHYFNQSISVRLGPDLSLFIGDDGAPSYHAPGHGDFFRCIRRSGVLGRLRDQGVKYLLFSNVDNLGATIDTAVIGHHIDAGRPMSAEVTEKRRTSSGAWDKGGAPARVAGDLQLVEGFRFPKDFAQESLPDFSTNNMLFDAASIDREIDLARHVVKKMVDNRDAIQLESITCEGSAVKNDDGSMALPLTLLRVPREGTHGRFFPVKEPTDLDAMREVLRRRLEDDGD